MPDIVLFPKRSIQRVYVVLQWPEHATTIIDLYHTLHIATYTEILHRPCRVIPLLVQFRMIVLAIGKMLIILYVHSIEPHFVLRWSCRGKNSRRLQRIHMHNCNILCRIEYNRLNENMQTMIQSYCPYCCTPICDQLSLLDDVLYRIQNVFPVPVIIQWFCRTYHNNA